MASADFCAFSTAFGSGYVLQRLPHRPPWVPHVSFTPSTCLIYPIRFRVAIGLYLVLQTYPRMRPYMRFLFVRPELCPRVSRFPESSFLQILPRDRHPCLRLCPSRYRADSGLTPVRNVRRQAHSKKEPPYATLLLGKPMVALALFSVFKRPCISRNHFVIPQSDPEIFLPTPVCREPSASGQQQITSCSVPYQPTALGYSFAFPVPSA